MDDNHRSLPVPAAADRPAAAGATPVTGRTRAVLLALSRCAHGIIGPLLWTATTLVQWIPRVRKIDADREVRLYEVDADKAVRLKEIEAGLERARLGAGVADHYLDVQREVAVLMLGTRAPTRQSAEVLRALGLAGPTAGELGRAIPLPPPSPPEAGTGCADEG